MFLLILFSLHCYHTLRIIITNYASNISFRGRRLTDPSDVQAKRGDEVMLNVLRCQLTY